MRGGVSESFRLDLLLVVFILFLCLQESSCSSLNHLKSSLIMDIKEDTLLLETSPTAAPQPLLPLRAPSPLTPFTNSTSPRLSDFQQLLVSQGANDTLQQICSLHPENLTEGSCPVKDVHEFESTVDSSSLLAACGKIDLVNECCGNAITEAAKKLALKAYDISRMDGPHVLSDHTTRVNDCKRIVHRWMASKLEPAGAKHVLRGLSNCKNNKAVRITALPAVASGQISFKGLNIWSYLLLVASMILEKSAVYIMLPFFLTSCISWKPKILNRKETV